MKTVRDEHHDFIQYYFIFMNEIKSIDEMRDEKIEQIIDNGETIHYS